MRWNSRRSEGSVGEDCRKRRIQRNYSYETFLKFYELEELKIKKF